MLSVLRFVIIALITLVMSFTQSVYMPLSWHISHALNMRNENVMDMALSHTYPDNQYGVMAMGISAFTPSFTLSSRVNGYRILEDTATHITVWVDESLTIHWKVDSSLGNVDIITFRKRGPMLSVESIRWWADMREYLYEIPSLPEYMKKYLDLPMWNKQWVPYLLMTPSIMLTATQMNAESCKPPRQYTPSVAVAWMLSHTYPIGSFRIPMLYSTHFKYFPGDDCVNSVSQSLYCGGMKTSTTWHPYTAQWIYVPKFWEYIIRHGWRRIPCTDAIPGDVLLFDVNLSGTPEHATLITGKVGKRPLYSGHTSHKSNMPVPLGNGDMWQCYHYVGR